MRLRPKRLAEGVYALMAFPPPKDNSGLIVGQHGALVIDAGINSAMAHQIQQTVRRLTDRPILWLANTVYHGDHTFGNAAFPITTKIITSRQTAASMTDLDAETRARAQKPARQPGRHRRRDPLAPPRRGVRRPHRGRPGRPDRPAVALRPRQQSRRHGRVGAGGPVAWTGNLLGHRRVAPMLLEGGPVPYIHTLARFKSTLDVKRIVPGHGPLADARSLDGWMTYLRQLAEAVSRARRLGLSALATVETVPLPRGHGFPRWHPAARMNWLVQDLHRLILRRTRSTRPTHRTSLKQPPTVRD